MLFAASLVSHHTELHSFVTACKLGHIVTHALSALLTHSSCSSRSITSTTGPLVRTIHTACPPSPTPPAFLTNHFFVSELLHNTVSSLSLLSSKRFPIRNIKLFYFVVKSTAIICLLIAYCSGSGLFNVGATIFATTGDSLMSKAISNCPGRVEDILKSDTVPLCVRRVGWGEASRPT